MNHQSCPWSMGKWWRRGSGRGWIYKPIIGIYPGYKHWAMCWMPHYYRTAPWTAVTAWTSGGPILLLWADHHILPCISPVIHSMLWGHFSALGVQLYLHLPLSSSSCAFTADTIFLPSCCQGLLPSQGMKCTDSVMMFCHVAWFDKDRFRPYVSI